VCIPAMKLTRRILPFGTADRGALDDFECLMSGSDCACWPTGGSRPFVVDHVRLQFGYSVTQSGSMKDTEAP
jgi:hypothetical protein